MFNIQGDQLAIAEKSFPALVKGLTGRDDIKIRFEGVPCTDGHTINLGAIDRTNVKALELSLGHLVHEIFHIVHTDFKQVSKGVGSACFPIINALEDVRIERLAFQRWPGVKKWREDLVNYMIQQGTILSAREDDDLPMLTCIWLFWQMHAEAVGYSLAEDLLSPAKKLVAERLPAEKMQKILDIAREAVLATTTETVVKCGKRIEKVLATEFSMCLEKLGNKNFSTVAGKTPSRGAKKVQNMNSISRNPQPRRFDMNQAAIDALVIASSTEEVKTEKEPVWPIKKSPLAPPKDFASFLSNSRLCRTRQGARLEKFLKASKPGSWVVRDSGREVHAPALAGLCVCETKVFRRDDEVVKPDAAFVVLLDRSGSMGVKTMNKAKEASYALCEILDNAPGSRCAALAFPGTERRTLLELKGFEKSARSCAERFCAVGAFGFTPVLQSLDCAADLLRKQPEKRKFIVVITDGLCTEGPALLKRAEEIEDSGIGIVCLGIGDSSPMIFDWQRNIADGSSNLAAELYQLMEDRLRHPPSPPGTAGRRIAA